MNRLRCPECFRPYDVDDDGSPLVHTCPAMPKRARAVTADAEKKLRTRRRPAKRYPI